MKNLNLLTTLIVLLALSNSLRADVNDPQIRTEHPWYPGELAMSTFERLQATQAECYRRVTGIDPKTDADKALASWFWRNGHYFHSEDAFQDRWGTGFTKEESRPREYWTGLFACGFGLCGTTHAQWSAEMERLLGHGRARVVGVDGHSSFEVFLTGGPYGSGKWALLDHDTSTVIYNLKGTALLSIPEIKADLRVTQRSFQPERQHGWLVSGLHPEDAPGVYTRYDSAAYLSGYAGPPPMVHLRRGEKLRRYFDPGLDDGKTFVFWGRNYNRGGIPGPERDLTWVNQPEKMFGSHTGTDGTIGRARFANAVYTYTPDFVTNDYREGVVDESDKHVTFAFNSPYIVGATPPDSKPYSAYEPGCKNGLVLRGTANCPMAVSIDGGKSWRECGAFKDGLDLTDQVKGRQDYLLRLGAGARELRKANITIATVCLASVSILPRLTDGGDVVRFEASGRGVISAGPDVAQAKAHVVAGAFNSPAVTLELKTPDQGELVGLYAAAQAQSGSPPDPGVKYEIDFSTDAGKSWKPLVADWTIPRRGDEPREFWSQSFVYGSADIKGSTASSVQVRFHNTGGKPWLRAEMHLVYKTAGGDATKVTFAWKDDAGQHREAHVFGAGPAQAWPITTGKSVKTHWVESEPVKGAK